MGTYWLEEINKQGIAAFNSSPSSYQVFRNVWDFGAIGDGEKDDTAAINKAISFQREYLATVDSSTVSPAVVYFPAGTYLVSTPIVSYYNTQLIGNINERPTLLAAPTFVGIAVIDENPYIPDGHGRQFYTPQNNFFREVRGFIIDLTKLPKNTGTGIHHQVSQATGLSFCSFVMHQGVDSLQQGIFIENGSGGLMSDLDFTGGRHGAWLGNQQFTVQRCTFKDCQVGIFQMWNWCFLYQDITVEDCKVGLEMRTGTTSTEQAVASEILADWNIKSTEIGVKMTVQSSGTLILQNIKTQDVANVVVSGEKTLISGDKEEKVVDHWVQGVVYDGKQERFEGSRDLNLKRPGCLLDDERGCWLSKPRPLYREAAIEDFINARTIGAAGDGKTDDAASLQGAVDKAARDGKILYIPHGTYLLSRTLYIPSTSRIVGEAWPILIGYGSQFSDAENPQAVVMVGKPGEVGSCEISEVIFSTRGPAGGAIVLEWNLAQSKQGNAGIWDGHIRIGGFSGSKLEADSCPKDQVPTEKNRGCFLSFHINKTASFYCSNVWVWTADHDLDFGGSQKSQINVLSGRGILIESTKPCWLWGQATEHAILYQMNIANARNVLIGMLQTETNYFSGKNIPLATELEKPLSKWSDPTFSRDHQNPKSNRGYGLIIKNSQSIWVLGAGLYSFFDAYTQECIASRTCQHRILSIETKMKEEVEGEEDQVVVFGINTIGTSTMVELNREDFVPEEINRNGFTSTVGAFVCR